MSKRGRRRNSKRRKSSSSSKQCVSPYMFQKNKSNSVSYRDDFVEKGETDAMLKENVQSGSEDEEKYNSAPPKEKRFKEDYHVDWFSHTKNIYTKTTKDEEKGVKIVTSVSVNDLEDSPPSILFQQSREPLCEDPTRSSGPVTNVLRINCSGSHVKLEIQEKHHNDSSGTKTTLVFLNEGGVGAEMFLKSRERTRTPSNEGSEPPANTSPNPDYTFTFGSISPQTEVRTDSQSISSTNTWDITNSCRCSCQTSGPPALLQRFPPGKRKSFHRSFSIEEFWDIPPPRQFADFKSDTLADLTQDLASCRIGADGQRRELPPTSTQEPEGPFPEPEEMADVPPSFDQLSESDNYEPMFMRPSLSTNRSSFTEDFINCQQRRSWIRSNSISTVEHRGCSLSRRRRQTFPGVLRRQEDLLPYSESLSSLIMCTLSFQTERLGSINQADDSFSLFETGSYTSAQTKGTFNKAASEVPDGRVGHQPLRVSSDCRRRSNRQHSRCEDMDALDVEDQTEVTDSGFDQEMGEVERHSPELPGLAIQVTPPSRSGSEEQMQPSHPGTSSQSSRGRRASDSAQLELSRSSAKTGQGPEQSFPQSDSRLSMCSCPEKHLRGGADPDIPPAEVTEGGHAGTTRSSLLTEDTSLLNLDAGSTGPDDSVRSEVSASSPAKSSPDSGVHGQEPFRKSDQADKHIGSRSSFESKEHLKPVQHKDLEGSSSEHWAKRRKLFKESRQWSSAGGSSITSDNPEESVVEDTHSMDVTVQDSQDRGFYTETFHSSAWIYQGDDAGVADLRPNLNTRARTVSIRERTVKISKGTGEYPWGFRIQFSKPIVVTEVDTNGAAEEAGLMVGDFVHAVNGIDVTSIPHSEAADLARQGPDVLTLTIGSDIARGPNTPRPACRGYLHKRTQSGLIKGWRKRWFVLTHDCCLYYYRHKRDEGRRRALSALKLEGAEVGPDISLGKPFMFKCRPQTGNRLFFFSATSNQEMKRWLEAMQKAVHPITQNHVWVDVTRHNSNLPPLAMKSPDCLGLLHKLDKSKDTWLQHYCILKDSCLYLYSGIRATHAHGGIYLQGYLVREQPYASKKSTIELKPLSEEFKTFYFCAENPTENQRWILAIKASVNKWLPLHRALQDYMNRTPEETRM